MRIINSIFCTAMLTLLVAAPLLAAESISQIQSLQGQVWVQRGDTKIEANSASPIYLGDLISTSDTGRLGTQLWSLVNLKLEPSSKIIISDANKNEKNASATQKIIKLEYGASCIETDHLMDSAIFFQMGDRVTIKFIKPAELCLSTDVDKSHIQLIKGSVELMHLTDSMLIALNEPGSEISFYNGGIFRLVSASRASPQVIPTEDPAAFSKTEDLKAIPKIVDLLVPLKTEDLKDSTKTAEVKEPAKTDTPIALAKTQEPKALLKTEDLQEPANTLAPKASSKIEMPIALSATEVSNEPSKTEDLKTPSKIAAPIALAITDEPKEVSKPEDLKEPIKTVDLQAPPKIQAPIALPKTENQLEFYNVYLNSSRSYESTAAVNRRLRDSGYSSFVIDEIDNNGPLFKVSVPNFETVTAARGFVEKVVVSLGIHDAWIERDLKQGSKLEERKAPSKKESMKELPKIQAPIALAKTVEPKEIFKPEDLKKPTKTVDLQASPKTQAPIALPKTEDQQEFYNVYLNSSRSYESTAAVNRRLRDSGYSSFVIDEIDNNGPLFKVSVPNFETVTAARGFVEKVVVGLGIHDAWIERHIKQGSKSEERKAPSKKQSMKEPPKIQVPIALAITEEAKESTRAVDLKAPSKIEVPIALAKTDDLNKSAKSERSQESYNVYLNSSRSYEATAAVNRRLRDSGYSSFVIDEIDNQGPLFKVSVPNFESVTAARGFVDKVVVSLGIHDAWIERHLRSTAQNH